jgi:hypothetical protein
MVKYSNQLEAEQESVSSMTKTSNIFSSCEFASLMTVEGKLVGILMQIFSHHAD